jgi:GAF domain-containing protein
MLREGKPIGVITVAKAEAVLFSDRQVELLKTFADQALIAIENTRLFEEVQARTRELQEALEYQTATSEVLGVISRAPSQLQPVFEAIVRTATRLCEAEYALVYKLQDGKYHVAATNNAQEEFIRYAIEHPLAPTRGSLIGRTALENRTVHMADCLADPEYEVLEYQRVGKYRTMLGVPLLRDGITVGVIGLMRNIVKPFNEKQIDLITTFADQAVIAIENVRLFEEVQARTEELTEALRQQTATAEVLKVISRSTFDLQAVLDTLTQSAAQLCEASMAAIVRPRGDAYYWATSHGFPPAYSEYIANYAISPGRGTVVGRVLLEASIAHIPDVLADTEYDSKQAQQLGGYRAILGVPLLREGSPIGVLLLMRSQALPFSAKEIELAATFADQAVIAIENVRLFDEVQARTQELARSVSELQALGEVTHAVNSTLDLETVLNTIVAKAVQLSATAAGAIYVFSNLRQKFRLRATYGMSDELIEAIKGQHIDLSERMVAEAAARRTPIQIPDIRGEPPTACSRPFRAQVIVPC